ncbi:MAG: DUF86 domain-containing protein [Planctomycetes bacterium]|nr:DUF86 domain-containing protein [Planctomycetota bacterium]
MQPERLDLKYLWDMRDAATTVGELTAELSLDQYERAKTIRLAVERSIEIIGEAARRVSPEFRAAHPEIALSAIIATRHIIAHEYGDIQHDKIWRIATVHVPRLVVQLTPIIEANPPEDIPPQ